MRNISSGWKHEPDEEAGIPQNAQSFIDDGIQTEQILYSFQ